MLCQIIGVIAYYPYSKPTNETAGNAVQFTFATDNIKDKDVLLMHSYDAASGTGFYVKGNVAGIYCAKGVGQQRQERKFRCKERITMAVVVEPASRAYERGNEKYATIKMYLNGEEVACLGYVPGQNAISQNTPILFDGREGDFYLYYIMAYESYYEWSQAFSNYLAKQSDVDAMMAEFENEDVLDTLNRPSLDKLKAKGMPYYVVVAPQKVFDEFDGDTNTSTKFTCTLFYFNPKHPEFNFKAVNVQWRRQGTTSAKRPIKNDRFYLNKPVNKADKTVITLLNPNEETELGRRAIALAAKNFVLVQPDAIPVQIITVKVDYSDSSNANDCGVCDMMNSTFKAMGSLYQTPAQRAFDGTFTKGDLTIDGCKMDHSTKNHPIAAFRATNEQLTDAWFHAKGNWKEDKGEQLALGFKDTPGYNKGCLNYGDFVEFFGKRDETPAQIEARFKSTAGLATDKVYLLSQYCGRDYLIMRHNGTEWQRSTGSMKQTGGKWVVSGDVLNPVFGVELLSYQGFCWWKGVSGIDEMMKMEPDKSSWVQKLVNSGDVSADTFPKWTQYFECMIDNDQLQIDLAYGRKVPYELYRMLRFCHDCDMIANVDGMENRWQITEDATKVANWRNNLWQYVSPQSLYAYTLFTDYLAATDQRAKNMQPMWFLEDGESVTNGVYSADHAMRMYLNKVYDCDTCNGKDNDGGCTVDAEADPNRLSDETYTNPYSGYGSVLFNNVAIVPTVYLDATHSGNMQLSIGTVAAAMRSAKTDVDGINMVPFSPEGAQYFFVEKRLKFWKKLISSYDGERKYIESVGRSDDIYFYALQGLGLTALPQFIEQRWRIRDGYYQTGQFFSGVVSGRTSCAGSNARIRIKAAKTGYFGIGHEAPGQLDEAVFLTEGQEHYFTKFSHTESALTFIYQADRLAEIDLSEISLDNHFKFDVMTLAEKIVLGSESHSDVALGAYEAISGLELGSLPFLRELDVRNTTIVNIKANGCPRLEKVWASRTALQSIEVAETSPVDLLELPDTMTELKFVNLPNLSYPGGLSIAGLSNVTKLMIAGCPMIDAMTMIKSIADSGGRLKAIGLRDVNITASADILQSIKAGNAYGLDENGADITADQTADFTGRQCSGLTGRWIMNRLTDESVIAELAEYFPALELHNSQYSMVMFDDIVAFDDTQNLTNLENGTSGADYEASGHFLAVEAKGHTYKCMYNAQKKRMLCKQVADDVYTRLADGTAFDPKDIAGEGFDVMRMLPEYWYKGINDYKNQKKYIAISSIEDEPLSTSMRVTRKKLGDIMVQEFSCVYTSVDGVALKEGDDYSLSGNANVNVYGMEVGGMKQVRFPGMNNGVIGAVFVDKDDKVVSTFNMLVNHAEFDFVPGNYVFCDVPKRAERLLFSSFRGFDDEEAIAVDSSEIEAIEPDWVHTKKRLVGVYGLSIDQRGMGRSISGSKTQTGTGTDVTSGEWKYDANGNVTNTELPAMLNYTAKDLLNVCNMRGEGFHGVDYEMWKDVANLVMALVGDRDVQAQCGYGCSSQYVTGGLDSLGNKTVVTGGGTGKGNLMLGIQNFIGCNGEWVDNVAANVPSFLRFKKDRGVAKADYVVDDYWNIYDAQTGTERRVKDILENNGCCIARVKHGRYCDIVAARVTADDKNFNHHYGDEHYYGASTGRAVLRSGSSAYAVGGIVFAQAYYGSSFSHSHYGSRLAFSGEIEIEE